MNWLKSTTTIVVACFLVVAGIQGYGLVSMRSALDERITSLEEGNVKADERIADLSMDLDVVAEKVDVTELDLQDAQATTKQLKRENAQLLRVLSAKADSKSLLDLQNDTTTKISTVHQDATTKIDGVSGDVKGVRTDLDATRNDLKTARSDLDATRSDLKATKDEVANSRRDLSTLIARNSSELADLRRKGEREYFEFDLIKGKQFKRVGDVMLQLKKTDEKRQKYEVVVNADDQEMQKKDRLANEPVSFVVGRERLNYELVVNYVGKDRVRGYISSPKDRVKAGAAL
jgi:chromosome segregation ATPase